MMTQQHIHVSSKTYKSPNAPSYVVLVSRDKWTDGQYYRVNAVGLELLRRGWTPEKIGLDPIVRERGMPVLRCISGAWLPARKQRRLRRQGG
jgi:hypothetical protein